jgi:hypothetical protein
MSSEALKNRGYAAGKSHRSIIRTVFTGGQKKINVYRPRSNISIAFI